MILPAFFRAPSPSALLLRYMIGVAAVLLTVASQWPGNRVIPPFADEWLRDRFIQVRADARPDPRILVVDIGEASLTRYPWPWPRTRLAELVENVLASGARGVALDILQEKPADPAGDNRMAMLARHGPVVLAQLFDFGVRDSALRGGVLGGGQQDTGATGLPRAQGYIGNHAELMSSPYFGNIGVLPDADGTLRQVPMYTYFEGRRYPTLARALFDCCAAGAKQPERPEGFVRISYKRRWEAYKVAEAADVLDGNITPADIAGRLVLIGSSSLSIGDRVATPLNPLSAGLLVHAAVLSSLLDAQAGLAPAPWPGAWMAIAYALAVALLVSYAFPRLSALTNIGLLAGSSLLWIAIAYVVSPHDGRFSTAGPLLSNLFLLAIAVPFQWQLTQQRSHKLLGTLRQYVATEVVDELLRSNMTDPLAPRLLQVTTLIADMEGYTTQVESLSLEEAARLTTEFLDCLTRPVLDKHGTLDKYTGDGMVAFWGAPLPNVEHADLALDAAQDILREVRQLSRARVSEGKPALRVRIGIESGMAMAGDYGTAFRSIYTAVGDSVNTASRLEQEARNFPHDVIIGEGTVAHASRHRFALLGERLLRGKEKPIKLYTLAPEDMQEASA